MPKRPLKSISTSVAASEIKDEDRKPLSTFDPLHVTPNDDISSSAKDTITPSTPKKPKKESKSLSPSKVKDEPGTPGRGVGASFPAEVKKLLVERAMDLAYKGLPWAELAQESGISESRLKDQFKPGRSNLRKAILELYSR
ncbi:hypothetical protein IAT40_000648 [Kwoniella sp. CBS 6097]